MTSVPHPRITGFWGRCFSRLIVRLVKFLQAKLNGVRLRLAVTWFTMNGVQVGSSVYIGRRVSVRLGRNSTLVIGNNVAIMDDCILVVHDEATLRIGASTFINHHCEISSASDVSIGSFCAFGPFCMILDTGKIVNDPTKPAPFQGHRCAPVHIADGVWVGTKVVVLPGVRVGHNVVLGAGAVVNRSIPDAALAAGVPAKLVKCFATNACGNDG